MPGIGEFTVYFTYPSVVALIVTVVSFAFNWFCMKRKDFVLLAKFAVAMYIVTYGSIKLMMYLDASRSKEAAVAHTSAPAPVPMTQAGGRHYNRPYEQYQRHRYYDGNGGQYPRHRYYDGRPDGGMDFGGGGGVERGVERDKYRDRERSIVKRSRTHHSTADSVPSPVADAVSEVTFAP